MKAISIKQPWVWAFLNGKDVENRDWRYPPKYRGPILLHASKSFDRDGYAWIIENKGLLGLTDKMPNLGFPETHFQTSGIIARGNLVDVVYKMDSPWFFGTIGLVIKDVKPVPFFPCKGMLGLFDVDYPELT